MEESKNTCRVALTKETAEELRELQEKAYKLQELLKTDCVDLGASQSGHGILLAINVPLKDIFNRDAKGKPVQVWCDENYKKGPAKPKKSKL